jgi:hypothetical protein
MNPKTVIAPNPTTGVVSGSLRMVDPEVLTLKYTLNHLPRNGTVKLNSTTGAFTYTPTVGGRLLAGSTPQADFDRLRQQSRRAAW